MKLLLLLDVKKLFISADVLHWEEVSCQLKTGKEEPEYWSEPTLVAFKGKLYQIRIEKKRVFIAQVLPRHK